MSAGTDAGPVIVATGVSRQYAAGSGAVTALVDVDLEVADGGFTVVAGPSGSGKSTLLRILAGLDRPDAGSVRIAGIELGGARARTVRQVQRRHLAYVFQQPVDNLLPYLDAADHPALWRQLRDRPRRPSDEWLDAVGLDGRQRATMEMLSGGEQQRLAFAAAAASDPAVVLADEPTSQLDSASGGVLVEALRALHEMGRTLLVASHDPQVLAAADDVVRLDHGRRV